MSKHNGKQVLQPCPDNRATFTLTAIRQAGKAVEWVRNYPLGSVQFS